MLELAGTAVAMQEGASELHAIADYLIDGTEGALARFLEDYLCEGAHS